MSRSYEAPRHAILPIFLLGPNNLLSRLFSHALNSIDLSQGGKCVDDTVNPEFRHVHNMVLIRWLQCTKSKSSPQRVTLTKKKMSVYKVLLNILQVVFRTPASVAARCNFKF
jgi:hypothetical protein